MLLRLVTMALAQTLDLVTFERMVAQRGLAAEANPIVVEIFTTLGLGGVAAAKIALTVLIGALVIAAFRHGAGHEARDEIRHEARSEWAVIGSLPLAMAITAGIYGSMTNLASILG